MRDRSVGGISNHTECGSSLVSSQDATIIRQTYGMVVSGHQSPAVPDLGAHHEQVKLLFVPGNHLVDSLVIGHLIFLLQDCKTLIELRRGWAGRWPGSEVSSGVHGK